MTPVIAQILNKQIDAAIAVEAIRFILEAPMLPEDRRIDMHLTPKARNIDQAFSWARTPQGNDFWLHINDAADVPLVRRV